MCDYVCPTCHALFDNFKDAGFSEEQSLDLVKVYLSNMMLIALGHRET